MAKPNYSFEKRQREIAKKKKEEKLQEKNQRKGSKGPAPDDVTAEPSLTAPAPADADGDAGNN